MTSQARAEARICSRPRLDSIYRPTGYWSACPMPKIIRHVTMKLFKEGNLALPHWLINPTYLPTYLQRYRGIEIQIDEDKKIRIYDHMNIWRYDPTRY